MFDDDGRVETNDGETDCGSVENKVNCVDNADGGGVSSNDEGSVDDWVGVDTSGVDNNCDVCRDKMNFGKFIIKYSNFVLTFVNDLLNIGQNL